MTALRLVCHVNMPGDDDLPNDDAHPFWLALDELGDTIAASFKTRGLDPDSSDYYWENDEGSLLTMSSDVPAYAAYFWLYLPSDPAIQATLLPAILVHLATAKQALSKADWTVTLDQKPLIWNDGRFHLVA